MAELSRFERWWLNAWPHRMHIRMSVPHFLRSCPEPFRGEVLEVGSGSGWSSRRILETFPQVALTASDLDDSTHEAYEKLQAKYGQRLKVVTADVRALPFDRNSFDIVVAIHAMHHIAELDKALLELTRVLRPGGLLGITDENQHYVSGPLKWFWKSANLISRSKLEEQLTSSGLTVEASSGDTHFAVWARKPYEERGSSPQ